jgi:hypothetical protein
MPQSITVKGDDAAMRKLRATGARALRQRETFEAEARYAQRQLQGVPVKTGRLERSVKGGSETLRDVTDRGYVIGSKVPYARFVFGGTKHMAARPPRVSERTLGNHAADAVGVDLRRAS